MESGKYLQNPTFMGDGWYIRCSDDDGLVLVVRSRATKAKSIMARMRKILRDTAVPGILYGTGYVSTSSFPPAFKGLRNCWNWRLNLKEPMPSWGKVFPEVRVSFVPDGEDVHPGVSEGHNCEG